MKYLLALLLAALLAAPASGQGATDILLMEVPQMQAEPREAGAANVTNRDGYDNQPFFSPDGRSLYYTSIDTSGQADLYRINIKAGTRTRLTYTTESEYSPTPMPGGERLSTIRVEADGTQRLWSFTVEGDDPALVLEDIRPVGYHAWGDDHQLALFVLGDPPTLQLADARTGHADTLAFDIGRSLHKIPGQNAISFVHKESPEAWTIKALDLDTRAMTPIALTLPGREDYAWTPDGTLLMADGAVLYAYDHEAKTWQRRASLESSGVTNITRLAVSPDGRLLALVVDRPAP